MASSLSQIFAWRMRKNISIPNEEQNTSSMFFDLGLTALKAKVAHRSSKLNTTVPSCRTQTQHFEKPPPPPPLSQRWFLLGYYNHQTNTHIHQHHCFYDNVSAWVAGVEGESEIKVWPSKNNPSLFLFEGPGISSWILCEDIYLKVGEWSPSCSCKRQRRVRWGCWWHIRPSKMVTGSGSTTPPQSWKEDGEQGKQ